MAITSLSIKRSINQSLNELCCVCAVTQMFEEYLPMGDKSSVLSAEQGGSDDQHERKAAKDLKLWKSVLRRMSVNSPLHGCGYVLVQYMFKTKCAPVCSRSRPQATERLVATLLCARSVHYKNVRRRRSCRTVLLACSSSCQCGTL